MPQIARSCRRPINETAGDAIFAKPLSSRCHDHVRRVPVPLGSNDSAPTVAIGPVFVTEASRRGRTNSVNSTVIVISRARNLSVAAKREPAPIGFSVRSDTVVIFGLYSGSLRSSATKSKTTSGGRSMKIEPLMFAMGTCVCDGAHNARSGTQR